jgi:hypothetical protein
MAAHGTIETIRFPALLGARLRAFAGQRKITKSAVVKTAIEHYLAREEAAGDAFSAGCDLFGKYGSGDGDRSATYKARIRGKLHAARSAH